MSTFEILFPFAISLGLILYGSIPFLIAVKIFRKLRPVRQITLSLLTTVLACGQFLPMSYGLCFAFQDKSPSGKVEAGEKFYSYGCKLRSLGLGVLAKPFLKEAICLYESSGTQLERPGVLHQLWRLNSLIDNRDKTKTYRDQIIAIDPTILSGQFGYANAPDQEYTEVYQVDAYESTFSANSPYNFSDLNHALKRLKFHRLYLRDQSCMSEYFGSGTGITCPVLKDLNVIAKYYQAAGQDDLAVKYYAEGYSLCQALKQMKDPMSNLRGEIKEFERDFANFQKQNS